MTVVFVMVVGAGVRIIAVVMGRGMMQSYLKFT